MGGKLPRLKHSQTSPGSLQHLEPELLIERLETELAGERLERERMSQRVQELEGQLDKKLQRSASQPSTKPHFGVSKGTPYKGTPIPPPSPTSPNRTRGLHLPALRTIPHTSSPQRYLEEQAAEAAVSSSMERSRNLQLSRAERSKERVKAVERKNELGLNTWKERKAEKVERLKD